MTDINTPRKVIGMGETILDIIFKEDKVKSAVPGGSTFNAMLSLGRCGAPALLISELGADPAGEYILRFMRENHVDTSYMFTSPEMQTPLSLAFLDERNDATYSFYKTPPSLYGDSALPEVNADDIVLFGSYYAIDANNRERVSEFLSRAKATGAIIYYDVNYRSAHRAQLVRLMPSIIENLEYADIVRGSRDDFNIVYNETDAKKVYSQDVAFYTQNLIYTDGENPVRVFSRGDFEKEYPTEAVTAVSTIGAGDSFNAGLVWALLKQGITHEELIEGLVPQQWDCLIETAQRFARDCCGSLSNYVSREFATQLK